MTHILSTNKLNVCTLAPSDAHMVLDFYKNNRTHFEIYETDRPTGFYTLDFQKRILAAEDSERSLRKAYRYYLFLPKDPATIIGTVSFSQILLGDYRRAVIGYKIDHRYLRHGFASDAIINCILHLNKTINLHRIEAYIHPDNDASLALVNKLGFIYEGVAHDYVVLKKQYVDMHRFAYIVK